MGTVVFAEFAEAERYALEALGKREDVLIVNGLRGDADWFARSVRSAEAGVFDFDGTLHAGSQWSDVRTLLTPGHAAVDREEADLYFSRANGEPSPEEITRFLFNSVRRMAESKVAQRELIHLAECSPPRPGAVELLQSFDSEAMQTFDPRLAIVSFGLYDYIVAWCNAQGLVTPLIASTKLAFTPWTAGPEGWPVVRGANPLTFVGTHTKGYAAHAIVESFGVPMNRVLVVGDSPTDLHMMSEGNLAVLLLPHRDADPARLAFRLRGLSELWPRVAAVLVSDSLEPLASLRSD